MSETPSFANLTPDAILAIIERATGTDLTGLISPLPSYINRVYELRAKDGTKLVVKFYRPGRWSKEALLDEHAFVGDCRDTEIPVVPPMTLSGGSTLGDEAGLFFALYPKRAGRQLEINDDNAWIRLGALLGRLHLAGQRGNAPDRTTIDPRLSTTSDVAHLCANIIPQRFRESYRSVATQIISASAPLFDAADRIRIHGDFHRGNVLERGDEGLVVIDFDDMAMGPPVQDLWLVLPDRVANARNELELLLSGYERFRAFNRASLRCIEPLRAMRMIYFVAWCSRQVDDFLFKKNFPDWGSDTFWQKEINDLREQAGFVMESVDSGW